MQLTPLGMLLGDLSTLSAASSYYGYAADIVRVAGINETMTQHNLMKVDTACQSIQCQMSNVNAAYLGNIGAVSIMDGVKVSTFFLPLPDPALLPDGSPPPGGWPDPPDNSLRDLWDAAEIYAPNLNARNQMAVVANKIPPPAYLWMFLMKTRGSPWSRVQHEIAEIWLGGYSEFTIALLGGLKRIYVEPFTPEPLCCC